MYRYADIVDHTALRLVQISLTDGVPNLTLSRHVLKDLPPYNALSYTWGPSRQGDPPFTEADAKPIRLDGAVFRVFPTLYDALLQLAASYPAAHFWIDAICINQTDLREREAQVGIMNEVYRRAERCIVWLGPKGPRADRGLAVLTRLASVALRETRRIVTTQTFDYSFDLGSATHGLARYGLAPLTADDADALNDVYAGRWFQRVWIIQEVALARRVDMLLGDTPVAWDVLGITALFLHLSGLQSAMQLMLLEMGRPVDGYYGLGFLAAQKIYLIREWCAGHGDIHDLLHLVNFTAGVRESGPATVLFRLLMWKFGLFKAENRLDIVYGFQGILAHVAGREGLPPRLQANYSLEPAEMLQNVAAEILESTGDLTILTLVGDKPGRDVPGLPSWVPDFAPTPQANPIAGPAFASLGKFDASGSQGGAGVGFRVQGRVLHVSGFRLGHVAKVGVSFTELSLGTLDGFFAVARAMSPVYAPTGQPRGEALWRALLFDQDMSNRPAAAAHGAGFRNLLVLLLFHGLRRAYVAGGRTDAALQDYLSACGPVFELAAAGEDNPLCMFPPRSLLERICRRVGFLPALGADDGLLEGPALAAWVKEALPGATTSQMLMGTSLPYRRLVLLEDGYLGMAPESVAEGDEVWIVSGCLTPLVLRREDGEEAQGAYSLAGEAYVHGVMYGEAVKPDVEWQEIQLI